MIGPTTYTDLLERWSAFMCSIVPALGRRILLGNRLGKLCFIMGFSFRRADKHGEAQFYLNEASFPDATYWYSGVSHGSIRS